MPNWCSNTVEIAHEDPAMLKRAVDAFNRGELLNEFIPVPKELQIVAGRVGDDSNPDQIALEAAEQRNLEKFGYKTWYDFCVNEWGTKWDIGGNGDEVTIEEGQTDTTLCFESAWSPPCDAYAKLLDLGFSIRAYYYEPGMAFAGIWDNGDDDFYEYGGMTSEQVAEEFPSALDEMFGISESMAEYEAENADE
jgi:hypothetical protein